MSTRSQSPLRVAQAALAVGMEALPTYGSRCSRKTFTLPHPFVCLVLKRFFKVDYRRTAAYLADMRDTRQVLGLQSVPHFTTLQKPERNLLAMDRMRDLLNCSVALTIGRSE